MFIVRYADDFRIFCRTKAAAERTKIAITQWIEERLKLEVSDDKTRIVNVKRQYSDFLGFKIKLHLKKKKYVVKSHIADKNLSHKRQKLVEQAKNVAKPRKGYEEFGEIRLYNSMVAGIHNYYRHATHISMDCSKLAWAIMRVFTNRLRAQEGCRLKREGRELTDFERKRYGDSAQLRFVAGTNEPIYPIGYIQHKIPLGRKRSICCYTEDGRKLIHNNLRVNVTLMLALMKQPLYGRSLEYADNRISLFSAQWGKCAVTGREFQNTAEIHCHHKIPRHYDGSDKYDNLVLVLEPVHRLIHAKNPKLIREYLQLLNLNKDQLAKINLLREKAKRKPLT